MRREEEEGERGSGRGGFGAREAPQRGGFRGASYRERTKAENEGSREYLSGRGGFGQAPPRGGFRDTREPFRRPEEGRSGGGAREGETRVQVERLEAEGPPYTIFAGNLAFEVDERRLEGFFSAEKCKVLRTRVLRDREGRSKRFGFVEFGDANSLIVALEKNRKELLGRAIRLDIEKHALKTEERPNRLLCLPREVLSYMLENFAAARSIARLRGTCTAFKKHIDENPKLTKKVQTARTKAEADQLKRSAAAKRRPHTVWDDDHRVDYLAEMQDAIQAYKYGSDW